MWSGIFIVCFCTCLVLGTEDNNRDKRTIDFVLRGLADTFGYDVQKRPTMGHARVALAQLVAQPVLPAPKSTFFPPPVAPLPKTLPGPPTLSIKLFGGRQQAAPVAPLANPSPTPPATLSKPMPALPAPKKPTGPLPAAPKTTPIAPIVPPPPPAPPRPTPRPLLRENIMKTFNIAFNFNRDLNTVAPPAPSLPPVPPPPGPKLPKKTLPTSTTKIAPKPPLPSRPAPTPAMPPPPQTLPPVATPPTPSKPQLYQNDYDSEEYENKQNLEIDYDQTEPVNYDYKNFVKEDQNKDPNLNYEDSRERFKQSLETFWAGSPYLQVQNTGYKFLAENINPDGQVREVPEIQEFHNAPLEAPRNEYEEYEVLNGDYDESQPRNQEQHKFILYKSEYPSEDAENQEIAEDEKEADANASQNKAQKRKANNQDDEPSKKEQIVNKIIRDFREFERQRKNLPPDPNDPSNPIKIREKAKQERERQRVIKERGQRTKDAIQRNINRGKGFVEPAYTGVIHAPLQELYQYDHKSHWPKPFDVDIAASDVEKQFKRIQRQVNTVADFKSFYQPERYEAESDYAEPGPTKHDYSQYEKLHELDDASLSANARIENKQFGKITVSVRANNDTSTY